MQCGVNALERGSERITTLEKRKIYMYLRKKKAVLQYSVQRIKSLNIDGLKWIN